jgi:hypothetical protein
MDTRIGEVMTTGIISTDHTWAGAGMTGANTMTGNTATKNTTAEMDIVAGKN